MPGIFIGDGTRIQIPAGGLRIAIGDDGAVVVSPIALELALETWPWWLDVAIDHSLAARAARDELVAVVERLGEAEVEGPVKSDLLARECQASMVAVAASAFALDGFYAAVDSYVPRRDELRERFNAANTPRHRRISETIRRTFKLSGTARQQHKQLKQLFTHRDSAVHPPAKFSAPVKHDLLEAGVEWRYAAFGAANAVAATQIATNLIDECVNAPRVRNEPLVAWCAGHTDRSGKRRKRVEAELLVANE